MNILRRTGAKHGAKIQAWDMELLSRILAYMWFCMGIRPTVLHLLNLLHTIPRPPLILGCHTHPKKGGSGVVRVVASELIPEQ